MAIIERHTLKLKKHEFFELQRIPLPQTLLFSFFIANCKNYKIIIDDRLIKIIS